MNNGYGYGGPGGQGYGNGQYYQQQAYYPPPQGQQQWGNGYGNEQYYQQGAYYPPPQGQQQWGAQQQWDQGQWNQQQWQGQQWQGNGQQWNQGWGAEEQWNQQQPESNPGKKGNGKQNGGAQEKKKKEPAEMTLEEYNAQKKAKAEAAKAAAAKKAAEPKPQKPAPVVMSKEELDKSFAPPLPPLEAKAQGETSTPTTTTEKPKEEDNWDDDVSDVDPSPKAAAKAEDKAEAAPSPVPASPKNKGASSAEKPAASPSASSTSPLKGGATPSAPSSEKKADAEAASPAGADKKPGSPKEEEQEAETPTDDVAAEEEAVVVEKPAGSIKDPDPRPHMNMVFIGHVDAGKSTTCGNILYLTGYVDERTIEKYQREAKDKNRDSWFLAYIMDTSEEEKAKGKTVEVGRAQFCTENKRFTILDAPGHKSYVPNMISGASQADIGVLIISARKGEFETGFEKGGQTSEHAVLAKTLGVDKLIIAVNKMDDHSVDWAQSRYDEIVGKMKPFLRSTCGFKDDQVIFLPISGLNGDNLKDRKGTPAWYSGQTFFETIDQIDIAAHAKSTEPLRMPMLDGYRDMGSLMAIGKVEQGKVTPGMKCVLQPTGKPCTAVSIFIGEEEVSHALVGENITVKVTGGVSEEDLRKGFVLCPLKQPSRAVIKFKAQFKIIELVEERPILTAGYRCVIHFHTAVEDCEVTKLIEAMTVKAGKKEKTANPKFAKTDDILTCIITLDQKAALDSFKGCEKLGRFTLRDEGKTVGIGKILELPKQEAGK
eukprot:g8292.t1